MIRQLPIVIVLAALGAALQAWGSEQEVTPIIRFGDPADAVPIMVAMSSLSRVTGIRAKPWHRRAGRFRIGRLAGAANSAERTAGRLVGCTSTRHTRRQPDRPADRIVVSVDDDSHADGDRHSLGGRARVRSGEARVLILPLPTNDALPMGMVAGPPHEAPLLDALA